MLLSICMRCRFRLYSRMPWAMVVTTPSCRRLILCSVCENFWLYSCRSGGQSPVSSTEAKFLRVVNAFRNALFPLVSLGNHTENQTTTKQKKGVASDSHLVVLPEC